MKIFKTTLKAMLFFLAVFIAPIAFLAWIASEVTGIGMAPAIIFFETIIFGASYYFYKKTTYGK